LNLIRQETHERVSLIQNYSTQDQSKRNSSIIDTRLNEALLESVDSGLLLLGENTRKVIYLHLERNLKIRREEIALRFEEFKKALEDMFGLGAELINAAIIKELQTKLDLEEKGDFELTSHVSVIQEIHSVGRSKREKSE